MSLDVKVLSFFKVQGGYKFVKNDNVYTFSDEMMNCMKNQYILMGWKVFIDRNILTLYYCTNEREYSDWLWYEHFNKGE